MSNGFLRMIGNRLNSLAQDVDRGLCGIDGVSIALKRYVAEIQDELKHIPLPTSDSKVEFTASIPVGVVNSNGDVISEEAVEQMMKNIKRGSLTGISMSSAKKIAGVTYEDEERMRQEVRENLKHRGAIGVYGITEEEIRKAEDIMSPALKAINEARDGSRKLAGLSPIDPNEPVITKKMMDDKAREERGYGGEFYGGDGWNRCVHNSVTCGCGDYKSKVVLEGYTPYRGERIWDKKRRYDKAYLDMADAFGNLSHCKRAKVGCVIVHEDWPVIITGYNGTPAGFCNECEDENGDTKSIVIHSEQNALMKVARSGYSSEGATMYCTWSPCVDCAKLIIQSKVKRFVYRNSYRLVEGSKMLDMAGIIVDKM